MNASNGTRRLDWILSPEPSRDLLGPGAGLTVGVLALQGDFREHRVVLEQLGALTREVRRADQLEGLDGLVICLLYTSPSPRDGLLSRMPSSA